ncbi:MAG: zf-HC2 domain-containing protein [Anaerolineae bacterium]
MKRKQPNPDHLLHQQVAQLLSAYLDGQVDARERDLVEQHLSTCPTCRNDMESLRQTVRLLRQLPAVTPPYPFTLRPERVVPARPLVWRWLFGIPGLATGLVTLMCVIALAGALLYNRFVPHRSVIPIARAPVTYSLPTTPTMASIPGVVSTATPVTPGSAPAAAHEELGLPDKTPMLTPMQALPTPGQPVVLLPASPTPSPEAPRGEYAVPSPPMMQPGQESLAGTQPSPEWTEVPSNITVEEEISAQRYEGTAAPKPSLTTLPTIETTIEAVAVPPATETPTAWPPTEGAAVLPMPPPAIGATATSPATEMSAAPTPPAEKVALSPEPSPTAKAVTMPTETPAVLPPSEEAVVSAEPTSAAEVMAMPPATETLAMPTETPVVSLPSEEVVVSTEPLSATEAMTMPPATETPVMPTEAPASPPAEEAPILATEEAIPITPTAVEQGFQEAPSTSPTELEPTPTRIPIPVRDLRMTIKPGLIRIEGALPLPPGQPIQAELWCEGQIVKWAIPETQRGKVQEEGRFELELKAQPDRPDFDLFQIPPAHYEVHIVPLEFEAPVEARIPFDTFLPATKQP